MSREPPRGHDPAADFVIARTKLAVPVPRARSRIVARSRLLHALNDGLSARLTLVCAPTGWGKTTAVAEWAARGDARFVWVSLDPSDDEPVRFWRCVVSSLASAEPGLSLVALRRLRSPVVSVMDEILPALVNDLAEVPGSVVVVIDDYHVIVNQDVHEQLRYLIGRLPLSVHLVIVAYAEPPLRLGRMRAIGEVVDIGPEQLRFTDDEAAELLNRVHGLDLSADEIRTVQDRIEGWVAGLNLAALSLERADRRGRLLEALPADDRFLADYLWDEVVMAQPPLVRQFLIRTAVLERFCGPLADALTGRSDGAEVVDGLERANLFVVPVDNERVWFRYHHLFRGLLLDQLERSAPELIADLHRRASTWFADQGAMVEAIEHAIAAGDMQYAADEIERRWLEFFSAGHFWVMASWMDRLSADAIADHPMLPVVRATVARAIGRIDEIEEWVARVDPSSRDVPAPGAASSIEGAVAELRSVYRLGIGDVPGAIEQARHARELETVPGSIEHATAGYFLGVASFFDDPELASGLLREFLNVVTADEDDPRHGADFLASEPAEPRIASVPAPYAMALLAETHALRGELEIADRLAHSAMEIARRFKLEEFPSANQLHIALGMAPFARGDLDVADEHFERAVTLARRAGDRVEVAHTLVWLAAARARDGDLAGAQEAFEAARESLPGLGQTSMRKLIETLSLEFASSHAPAPTTESDPLTPAELRVLWLMPSDLTYRQMAERLYLSLNTVRTHARQILRKLGASSRSAAVARAREQNLLK